jgi:hypothetical protein
MFPFSPSPQFVLAGVKDSNNKGQTAGAAKKSLLELEKVFNDQILGELRNGMQSKESVDHRQLVGKVENTRNQLRQVYKKVINTYLKEERKAGLLPEPRGMVWTGSELS